jgi:hypothetical protein
MTNDEDTPIGSDFAVFLGLGVLSKNLEDIKAVSLFLVQN